MYISYEKRFRLPTEIHQRPLSLPLRLIQFLSRIANPLCFFNLRLERDGEAEA